MKGSPIVFALVASGVAGLAAAIAAQGTAKVPGNAWLPAQRQMSQRAGSTVSEVAGSHAVYVSRPEAVASVIAKAAATLSR